MAPVIAFAGLLQLFRASADKLSVDTADLQKRFYSLSRQFHPDRSRASSAPSSSMRSKRPRCSTTPTGVTRSRFSGPSTAGAGRLRYRRAAIERCSAGTARRSFELNMLLEETPERDELERRADEVPSHAGRNRRGTRVSVRKLRCVRRPRGSAKIRGVLNRRRYIQNLVRDVEKALGNPMSASRPAIRDIMSTFQIDFGEQKSPVVGIDLGTTNSLVAVMDPPASPKSSPDRTDRRIVPSVVSVIGRARFWSAQPPRMPADSSGTTVYSVKRLMGRGIARRAGRTEAVSVPHRRRSASR